jgi:hypothetical protein
MARKTMPKGTVPAPQDAMGRILDGAPAGAPERHPSGSMASHTDGDDGMTKLTHRVTQELADALRKHYHERRLAGEDVTMSAIVEAALRKHLGMPE